MANYQAGFQAKGRINSTAYAMESYQISDEAARQEVSNTEGIAGNSLIPSNVPGYSAFIGGLKLFTTTINNATFDVLSNPFTAPFSISSSTYIALRVFLNGAAGVSWNSPSFYVERAGTNGNVKGLQPISFTGYGDGSYTVPAT